MSCSEPFRWADLDKCYAVGAQRMRLPEQKRGVRVTQAGISKTVKKQLGMNVFVYCKGQL